jgi:membrane protein required for colicin V production
MQPYDIAMLLVLAATTVYGFWKGLAWQIASVCSLVASYFVALKFSDQVAPMISAQAPWNKFLAMLALYLGTSAAIWLVFRIVSGAIDRVKLREFDRQIGGLVGAAKGVLVCVVITFFAVTLSEDLRGEVLHSRSGYYIALLIHKATPIMPKEVQDVLGPYLEKLDEKLDPNTPPARIALDPAALLQER